MIKILLIIHSFINTELFLYMSQSNKTYERWNLKPSVIFFSQHVQVMVVAILINLYILQNPPGFQPFYVFFKSVILHFQPLSWMRLFAKKKRKLRHVGFQAEVGVDQHGKSHILKIFLHSPISKTQIHSFVLFPLDNIHRNKQ